MRPAGQTAAMIGAGRTAGVTGRDALHAVIAAAVVSTEDDAEAALAVLVIQDDLALLAAPTITRLYRQAGREGWRRHRGRKAAQAAATRMLIDSLYGCQPGTLHLRRRSDALRRRRAATGGNDLPVPLAGNAG